MMMGRYASKVTAAMALLAAVAICAASCSSSKAPPGMPDLSSMQLSPAPAGSCRIDAVKMCQLVGGGSAPPTQPSTMSSYGPPTLPDSYEFQIPAGQNIKLMCYYDPQHASVYRADATPDSALTGNSVEYMKQRGLCANK